MFRRWCRRLLVAGLALAVPAAGERLPTRVFGIEHGLAGDAVVDIAQDARGFLWVATTSGLSRFDGESFRSFETAEGLPSARVNAVRITRDGTVFAGTDGGLASLTAATPAGEGPPFRSVPLADGSGVGSLFEDAQGRLWVGGPRLHRVMRSADGSWGSEPEPLPGVHHVGALAETPDGAVWAAAAEGLWRFRDGEEPRLWRFAPGRPEVAQVAVDTAGRLWIAQLGLVVLQLGEDGLPCGDGPLLAAARPARALFDVPERACEAVYHRSADGLDLGGVRDLHAGADGSVWIAAIEGAARLGDESARTLTFAQGLPATPLHAAFVDRAGAVWIGSEGSGLCRLAPSGFVTFDQRDGLAHPRISDILELDGELFVGAYSRHLYRFEHGRLVELTPRASEALAAGWGWGQFVTRTRDGAWWWPTGEGLLRFGAPAHALRDAAPARRYLPGADLPGGDVFRFYEDRSGDLWISVIAEPPLLRASRGGGKGLDRFDVVAELAQPPGGAPTAFTEDEAGNLWVGFYAGGLARRSPAGAWRLFGAEQGVPPGFVSDLFVDSQGRLWIATASNGLLVAEDPGAESPRFRRLGAVEGLATSSARCVTEDRRGRIWVGTSRGIDRLEPDLGRSRHFGIDDGLPSHLVRLCHTARDGVLWFGTFGGLVRYDPDQERPREAPRVEIGEIRVRGVPLPIPELGTDAVRGVVLAPDQGSLQVDAVGIAVGLRGNLLYQHRFGAGAWSEPTRERTLHLSRLSPGRYDLEVRAVTDDGLASPTPATLSFRLLPPFWRRPTFLAGTLLATAALAWSGGRLRARRLLAVEQVRTRIAADLHDEVGAGLTRINVLGELARHRVGSDPATAGSMLDEIGGEARDLAEAASDIVWAIDPRKDDLGSLVLRLRRFAGDLLAANGVALSFESPLDASSLALRPEVRRVLYLALKEAIHNAAKHARASRVAVRIAADGRAIVAEVRDDGRGFDASEATAAEQVGRRGLVGMRERAAAVDGELAVESAPGGGTTVTLRLPLRHPARWKARPAARR